MDRKNFMKNTRKDLSNRQFGQLLVQYPLEVRKRGHIVWHCKCKCGNQIDVIGSSLVNGNTQSCGCLKYSRKFVKDLSNQRFGRLTAKYPLNKKKNGSIYWQCECDCGKKIEVLSRNLCSGCTRSCGCLRRERVGRKSKDLTNKKFGRLTAKYPLSEKKFGSKYWYCECICGKGVQVLARSLCAGKTRSCGCLRKEIQKTKKKKVDFKKYHKI